MISSIWALARPHRFSILLKRKSVFWILMLLSLASLDVVAKETLGLPQLIEPPSTYDLSDNFKPILSQKRLNIDIGNHHFTIPENYILLKQFRTEGRTDHLPMLAILPTFAAYGQTNRKEFGKPLAHNRILISIIAKTNLGGRPSLHLRRLEKNQKFFLMSHPDKMADEGQTTIPIANVGDIFFMKSDIIDKEMVVERWMTVIPKLSICTKEGKRPSPSCESFIDYSPSLILKYVFQRNHLDKWSLIDRDVHRFVSLLEKTSSTISREKP